MPASTPGSSQVLRRSVGTGPEVFARVSARVGALRRLGLDSVLAPIRAAMDPDGRVIVDLPRIDGTDLAELAQHRPPLSAGECAWLGAQVAAALASMHEAGLAHGDVSPANVLVREDGITLVDTVAGCLEDERGTAGFQSPERAMGATLPGDICSLGLLLRWCADASCTVPLEEWTAPMVLPDASARPTAAIVGDALGRSATHVPVIVPPTDVVTATRARIVERTQRVTPPRPRGAARPMVRIGIVAGVLAVAGAVILAVPPVVDAALAGEPAHSSVGVRGDTGPEPSASPSAWGSTESRTEQPAAAAARLTTARVDALARSDGSALRALAVPGELADTLDRLADRLESGELRFEGVDVQVMSTTTVSAAQERADVAVAYRVTGHTVVDAGVATEVEGFDQSVRMVLARDMDAQTGRQWRVESVTPSG